MVNPIRGLALILSVIICASCIGDRSIAVTFVNDTSQSITVFPYGRDHPDWQWKLGPAQTAKTSLLAGDARPTTMVARVEGIDAFGALVFCHGYTYSELQASGGIVHVRSGVLDCQ